MVMAVRLMVVGEIPTCGAGFKLGLVAWVLPSLVRRGGAGALC